MPPPATRAAMHRCVAGDARIAWRPILCNAPGHARGACGVRIDPRAVPGMWCAHRARSPRAFEYVRARARRPETCTRTDARKTRNADAMHETQPPMRPDSMLALDCTRRTAVILCYCGERCARLPGRRSMPVAADVSILPPPTGGLRPRIAGTGCDQYAMRTMANVRRNRGRGIAEGMGCAAQHRVAPRQAVGRHRDRLPRRAAPAHAGAADRAGNDAANRGGARCRTTPAGPDAEAAIPRAQRPAGRALISPG